MNLEDSIIKLKDAIAETQQVLLTIYEDSEVMKLVSQYEATSDELEQAKIEKKVEAIQKEKIDNIAKNFSKEEVSLLFENINEEFFSKNHIRRNDFLRSHFECLFSSLIKLCDKKELISLSNNSDFVEAINYNPYNISDLLIATNDPITINNFLNKYFDGTYPREVKIVDPVFGRENSSDIYGEVIKNILSSDLSYEYKESIFNNEQFISGISNQSFKLIATNNDIPIKMKRELLNKEEVVEMLDSFTVSTILASTCETKEECENILFNSKFSDKIEYVNFFSNIKISHNNIADFLEDERLKNKIEGYQFISVLSKTVIPADRKYNLLISNFNQFKNENYTEVFHYSKDYEFRKLFLKNDEIFNHIMNSSDKERFLSSIFGSYYVEKNLEKRLDEKYMLIEDERMKQYFDVNTMNCIMNDQNIPLEKKKEILFQPELYSKIFNDYHPTYNPNGTKSNISSIRKEYLNKMINDNPMILNEINLNIFNDDFIVKYDYSFLEKISKYRDVTNSFSGMDTFQQECFYNMFQTIKKSEFSNDLDIELFTTRLLTAVQFKAERNIKDSQVFSKMVMNKYENNKIDISKFSEEHWKIITEIALRENSPYYVDIIKHNKKSINLNLNILPPINSIDDLKNYNNNRYAMCDKLFSEAVKEKNIENAQNAYFNKYFSINIEEAKEIVRLYGDSIEKFDNKVNKQYINALKNILSIKNVEILSQAYNENLKPISYDMNLYLDQSMKQMFAKNISDSLLKVGESDVKQNTSPITYVNYQYELDGKVLTKQIPIYSTGLDFKMLVHSTCAYGEMQLLNDNYSDSWNKSDRKKNHGICCSIISNDNMGMAEIKDVLLGFDGFDPKAFYKSAPYDIYTSNDDYQIEESRPLKFMSIQDIIDNTRHTHNESTIERMELRKEKITPELPNLQPGYVIICSDMTDELKQKAIKCASDMNIPIVYLDKQKIIENEVRKIDSLIQKSSNNININELMNNMRQIILSHENNRSGLRASNPEWVDKYFPTEKIDTFINQTIQMLQQKAKQDVNYKEYATACMELMDILEREEKKFDITMESVERINFIDLAISDYEEKMMKFINPNLCQNNNPKFHKIMEVSKSESLDSSFNRILDSLDTIKINDSIQELVQQNLYTENSKNHNIGHIERVIAYSMIIGNNALNDEFSNMTPKSVNLLIECAKYHDCGRENDNFDRNHAKRSSEKVDNLLKNKYKESDLAVIKTVIEYHEIDDDEFVFNKICDKYNVPRERRYEVEQLAKRLKDADALDRVRFQNPKATLDETKLRIKSSRDIVPFAKELVSQYKHIDKKMFEQVIVQMSYEQNISQEVIETQEISGGIRR